MFSSIAAKVGSRARYTKEIYPYVEQTLLHNRLNDYEQCLVYFDGFKKLLLESYKNSAFANSRDRARPIIFLSYAWFIEKTHPNEWWTQAFLVRFAQDLYHIGFDPRLDVIHSRFGPSSMAYMREQIETADIVCPVGSRSMATKMGNTTQPDQYFSAAIRTEMRLISNRKVNAAKANKPDGVMPLLLTGETMEEALPENYTQQTVTESFQDKDKCYLQLLSELTVHCIYYFKGTPKEEYLQAITQPDNPIAQLVSSAKRNSVLGAHLYRVSDITAQMFYDGLMAHQQDLEQRRIIAAEQFLADYWRQQDSSSNITSQHLPQTTRQYLSGGQDFFVENDDPSHDVTIQTETIIGSNVITNGGAVSNSGSAFQNTVFGSSAGDSKRLGFNQLFAQKTHVRAQKIVDSNIITGGGAISGSGNAYNNCTTNNIITNYAQEGVSNSSRAIQLFKYGVLGAWLNGLCYCEQFGTNRSSNVSIASVISTIAPYYQLLLNKELDATASAESINNIVNDATSLLQARYFELFDVFKLGGNLGALITTTSSRTFEDKQLQVAADGLIADSLIRCNKVAPASLPILEQWLKQFSDPSVSMEELLDGIKTLENDIAAQQPVRVLSDSYVISRLT